GSLGPPSGRYIAPASNASCIQVYNGQCAPQSIFLTGPGLTRFDLSVVKRIQITERVNVELRGEMINAFNNINFRNPTGTAYPSPSSLPFGQVTTAFWVPSTPKDRGGGFGQIVAGINFWGALRWKEIPLKGGSRPADNPATLTSSAVIDRRYS